MRLITWIVRAILFLLLFALALNNLHDVDVRGLFGTEWRAPMIVVILVSFAGGAVLALVALWPRARLRRGTAPPPASAPTAAVASPRAAEPSDEPTIAPLNRDGL